MSERPMPHPYAPGPLVPGSRIGILGGGQLGRMLATAAAKLGFRVHVFCPSGEAPAVDVAWRATRANYDDEDALARFADAVDVVTYEFENVPVATVGIAARVSHLRPGARYFSRFDPKVPHFSVYYPRVRLTF